MAEVSTEPLHIKTSEIIAEKGEGPWYEPLFSDIEIDVAFHDHPELVKVRVPVMVTGRSGQIAY